MQLSFVVASAFLSHETRVAASMIEPQSERRYTALEIENASARSLIADLMSQVDALLIMNAKLAERLLELDDGSYKET